MGGPVGEGEEWKGDKATTADSDEEGYGLPKISAKATSFIVLQKRTGSIVVHCYLWRIRMRLSPRCTCNLDRQAPQNVLLDSPGLDEERLNMHAELVETGISLNLRLEDLVQ